MNLINPVPETGERIDRGRFSLSSPCGKKEIIFAVNYDGVIVRKVYNPTAKWLLHSRESARNIYRQLVINGWK